MSESAVYRPASETDIPAIASLLEAAGMPASHIDEFITEFLVAEVQGKVVACGGLEFYDSTAVLRSVTVDQSARGTGIGKELSRALLQRALTGASNGIYLFTADAWTFWQKLGFEELPLEQWPPAPRQCWQYQFVAANPEIVQRIGLRSMYLPPLQHP